ncbi:MAG TPA: ATP-binding cassette domain-containing protein [Clostridia bacterium]|nr:ATP-binding cassette domain-containing protein [Clostridia bacterium]
MQKASFVDKRSFVCEHARVNSICREAAMTADALARPVTAFARAVLEVAALDVHLPTEDGDVHAVRGVDFALEPGEVLAIVGESGSGKSITSLALLGLLPKPARVSGSVRFRGRELLGVVFNKDVRWRF